MPRFVAYHKERKKAFVVIGLLFDDFGDKITDVRLADFYEPNTLLSNRADKTQWVRAEEVTLNNVNGAPKK